MGSGSSSDLRERPAGSEKQPAGLDAASAHWRLALDAAADAIQAARGCRTSAQLSEAELSERSHLLDLERKAVIRLLDEVAAEERVLIHHRLSAPRATRRTLGLPDGVLACVFDLDGVLTASAALHAEAWGETFDALLSLRVDTTGERFAPFRPFDRGSDYAEHIHGKPRLEGVAAFLASRGIRLPEGRPDDSSGAATVYGLANRKNERLLRHLDREGVDAFEGSQRYLEEAHEVGLRCAVVSASANTEEILERAGLAGLVDVRVDGNTITAQRLRSKPAPDTLLAACRLLGVAPGLAAAFETTPVGVAAARAAGFGFVLGVDRRGRAEMLPPHGADGVVTDLSVLLDAALAT